MVQTYLPHMNQIQAGAGQPCLSGYALSEFKYENKILNSIYYNIFEIDCI